ncbi:MAG: sigma-54-dependent Fis family transcriptional regulator [Candidatus Binataceae bacterium]|nr:sigma-54-dependent Fis family transcriptional regulator [Candidatus Binataceae bacterium]
MELEDLRENEFGGRVGDNEWVDVEALLRDPEYGELVGSSSPMRAVYAAIDRFAPYKGTVMVLGESGSGKELVARALHRRGPFPAGPLVTFNCSNLVHGLAESQLFGHVRGAFTDAREAYTGCFREADGGTLLLDEIGELPLPMQSKILRAVENFEIQPVGSIASIMVNLRLIAATNRDLPAMVKRGEFRADLYYRLAVTAIALPPLRQRLDDTAALAAHFVAHYNRAFGKRVQRISYRALTLIGAYRWPGNVRELAHVIERATLLCDNDRIDVADLPPELVETAIARMAEAHCGPFARGAGRSTGHSTGVSLDDATRAAVQRSLITANGDCAKAARMLGISRPAIYRKMLRFGLSGGNPRRRDTAAGRASTDDDGTDPPLVPNKPAT